MSERMDPSKMDDLVRTLIEVDVHEEEQLLQIGCNPRRSDATQNGREEAFQLLHLLF